jgi:hypothetical protein
LTICGSIRRNKPDIGDVDIVVQPKNAHEYLNMMDNHIHQGIYNKGKNSGGRETWGNTKRLLNYQGINFDVIVADAHQFGYKVWLSTGPRLANERMMILLKNNYNIVRPCDGYLWHVTYTKTHPNYEPNRGFSRLGKLNVPDEFTFFHLIGLPTCHAEWRSEAYYQKKLGTAYQPSALELQEFYVEEAKPVIQKKLF